MITDTSAPALFDGPELAAALAGKLCHDFISPSGAIVSGLDLLNDPTAQDMREDALALIADSADRLVAHVQFARVAFGGVTGAERFAADELNALVAALAKGGRATLEWSSDQADFTRAQARALVNLAWLTLGALPTGGVARVSVRVEDGALVFDGLAEGARARLKAEAVEGLAGRRLGEGLPGQWIQPYWLWLILSQAGGSLAVETAEGSVRLTGRMPS